MKRITEIFQLSNSLWRVKFNDDTVAHVKKGELKDHLLRKNPTTKEEIRL